MSDEKMEEMNMMKSWTTYSVVSPLQMCQKLEIPLTINTFLSCFHRCAVWMIVWVLKDSCLVQFTVFISFILKSYILLKSYRTSTENEFYIFGWLLVLSLHDLMRLMLKRTFTFTVSWTILINIGYCLQQVVLNMAADDTRRLTMSFVYILTLSCEVKSYIQYCFFCFPAAV